MKKYLASLFLGSTLVLAACGGGSDDGDTEDDNASESSASQGEEIARDNCASCHGQDFEGGSGPALKGTDLSEDDFKDIVENGTDEGMPSFGDLSDEELDELYQFFADGE